MRFQGILAVLTAAILSSACANQGGSEARVPEKGDPSYFKLRDSMADEVYVNEDGGKKGWIDTVRRIYIAPVNASQMQIIQPDGVDASDLDAWEFDDVEQEVLQKKFATAMTRALEIDQAYHVVDKRADAQAVLSSRIIALHPYVSRSEAQAGTRVGGAATMSFALIDPSDNTVMIRALDSKSTDNIWAFDNVDSDQTALDFMFALWGQQIRRSVLFLQGRLAEMPQPILLKPQS